MLAPVISSLDEIYCMHKRVHDRPLYDFQDVRIITKAIRDLLKIGYPKDEVPLKKPRASVQVQNIYNLEKVEIRRLFDSREEKLFSLFFMRRLRKSVSFGS